MKITQEVREAAQKGMDEMSEAFKRSGSEIYQDVERLEHDVKHPAAE
jgi:hypothetical protein